MFQVKYNQLFQQKIRRNLENAKYSPVVGGFHLEKISNKLKFGTVT